MKYLPILLLLAGCTWEKPTPYQQAIQNQHPIFHGTGFAMTQDGYMVLPQNLLTQSEHDALVAFAKSKTAGEVVGVTSLHQKGITLKVTYSVRQGPALAPLVLDAKIPSAKLEEYMSIWAARGHKAQAAKADNPLPMVD